MLDVRCQQFVITGIVRHEAATGWLVLPKGTRDPVWLPRRLTQIVGAMDPQGFNQFAIPRWVARAKGLADVK